MSKSTRGYLVFLYSFTIILSFILEYFSIITIDLFLYLWLLMFPIHISLCFLVELGESDNKLIKRLKIKYPTINEYKEILNNCNKIKILSGDSRRRRKSFIVDQDNNILYTFKKLKFNKKYIISDFNGVDLATIELQKKSHMRFTIIDKKDFIMIPKKNNNFKYYSEEENLLIDVLSRINLIHQNDKLIGQASFTRLQYIELDITNQYNSFLTILTSLSIIIFYDYIFYDKLNNRHSIKVIED